MNTDSFYCDVGMKAVLRKLKTFILGKMNLATHVTCQALTLEQFKEKCETFADDHLRSYLPKGKTLKPDSILDVLRVLLEYQSPVHRWGSSGSSTSLGTGL